jgi:hypothetical protein
VTGTRSGGSAGTDRGVDGSVLGHAMLHCPNYRVDVSSVDLVGEANALHGQV